jgi:hypothetical protein
MYNWVTNRPLIDRDHRSILGFLTVLMKLNIATEYEANMVLLMSGSNYRIPDPEYTRHLDIADELSGILESGIRRTNGRKKI